VCNFDITGQNGIFFTSEDKKTPFLGAFVPDLP
jgi:hypothetical protein